MNKNFKVNAIILAAGIGTRLRPVTDFIPKPLMPVGGVPLLESIILKMKQAGRSFAAETDPDVRAQHLCAEAYDPEAAPDKIGIHCELEHGEFAKAASAGTAPPKGIRVTAYNLERGMRLDEQIAVFRGHPEFHLRPAEPRPA